jgi:hypothetical protein
MVRLCVLAICWLGVFPALVPGRVAAADEPLPVNVTFVTSAGFWEDPGPAETRPGAASTYAPAGDGQRGYYKLIALRQPDGTAHVVLQQIALDAGGPRIVSSAELEEFSRMRAFVTDMRPETSDGITPQPGLFVTVYLRTNPSATDVETWTVLIDEFGDIRIERETN